MVGTYTGESMYRRESMMLDTREKRGTAIMKPLGDRALLAQIARGDQEALRQLYIQYRPRLRRYPWRQLDGDAGPV